MDVWILQNYIFINVSKENVRFDFDMWGIWNGHAYNYALTFFCHMLKLW
jgi:hypothetical protein